MTQEQLNTGAVQGGEQELVGFTPKTAEPSGPDRSFDSPLKDAWAKPMGYTVKSGTSQKGRQWIRVGFRLGDLEVLDSEIPYPYPTGEINMFYADPEQTAKVKPGQGSDEWTVICGSMRSLMGGDRPDMLDVVWGGQVTEQDTQPKIDAPRLRITRIPTLLRVGPNDTNSRWHDEIQPTWYVTEIEGVGKLDLGALGADPNAQSNGAGGQEDLTQYVLNMADGKTLDGFNAVATNDPKVMSNPSIMTQIGDKVFLDNMVMIGMLTKDGDVYRRKA